MKAKIKVASLFSGVGGLDYGFHSLPEYSIVFANDIDKNACETYRTNFVGADNYLTQGPIDEHIGAIPSHDILIGGFPCQPFSMAGKRQGFADARGLQYLACVKTLERVKPSMFFLENVRGILSSDNGHTVERVVTELEDCGYLVSVEPINMWEYGVPQRRCRVMFVGIREDIGVAPTHLIPTVTPTTATLAETIGHYPVLPGDGPSVVNHNYHIGSSVKLNWIKVLREGENIAHLSQEVIDSRLSALGVEPRRKPETYQGYNRLDSRKMAPTMMFGNTCIPIHPTQDRSISVREAAAIQSFPDSFIFTGV